ncbi:MAG: hypothetical protein CENE_01170 [Candidatus Celerinatantimonas neptuna]|nr:MAG: hypothetical protein CENE_01170 [Candidatus Celerinatantimonas neptuna]
MMPQNNLVRDLLVTAFAPLVWGSTYLVTTQLLPPSMPLWASTLRALPAGIILLIVSRSRLSLGWWGKIFLLGILNIGFFFYCLFVAAYYLPGGLAALVMACQPIIVMVLSLYVFKVPLLKIHCWSALLGIIGIALLVLNSSAVLHWQGIVAGILGMCSMAAGIVLTKQWGRPKGVSLLGFTGWQLLIGGMVLLPVAIWHEGIPSQLSMKNVAGYSYLCVVGSICAYMLWFRGIERLPAVTISFLGFLSPLSACVLGYLVLRQGFSPLQSLGAVAIIAALVLVNVNPKRKAIK